MEIKSTENAGFPTEINLSYCIEAQEKKKELESCFVVSEEEAIFAHLCG